MGEESEIEMTNRSMIGILDNYFSTNDCEYWKLETSTRNVHKKKKTELKENNIRKVYMDLV